MMVFLLYVLKHPDLVVIASQWSSMNFLKESMLSPCSAIILLSSPISLSLPQCPRSGAKNFADIKNESLKVSETFQKLYKDGKQFLTACHLRFRVLFRRTLTICMASKDTTQSCQDTACTAESLSAVFSTSDSRYLRESARTSFHRKQCPSREDIRRVG